MTELLEHLHETPTEPKTIERVSIVVSKGSLEGIYPALSERHWLVVKFMRARYLSTGTAPSIRSLGKESGVPIKELYQLFPKGPAKLAAKIGGIPKPKGCI